MIRAFGARNGFGGDEPRALPWAVMKDAIGVSRAPTAPGSSDYRRILSRVEAEPGFVCGLDTDSDFWFKWHNREAETSRCGLQAGSSGSL